MFYWHSYVLVVPLTAQILIIIKLRTSNASCPLISLTAFKGEILIFKTNNIPICKRNEVKKGKPVPLRAWSGPEGSRKLRFPGFMTVAQDGGKVVSPTHWLPLPPGMLLVLISVGG